MSLSSKFSDEFSVRAREEGSKIFQSGSVQVEQVEPHFITAAVYVGHPYEVALKRLKGAVRYECECPQYFETGEPCKHIWATLLAADMDGVTGEWETSRHLDFYPRDNPEGDDYDDFDDEEPFGQSSRRRPVRRNKSTWKQSLAELRSAMAEVSSSQANLWPVGREILYVINTEATRQGREAGEGTGLVVDVQWRERKKNGDWSKPRRQSIGNDQIPHLPDPRDREILSMLIGAAAEQSYYYSSYSRAGSTSYRLNQAMQTAMTQRMCQTGRCMLRLSENYEPRPISWDETGAWELWVVTRKSENAESYLLIGELRRGEQRMELSEPDVLVQGGLIFWRELVAPLDDGGAFPWIVSLRSNGSLEIPAKHREELLQHLLTLPRLPRLELPEELKVEEVRIRPQVRLRIHKPKRDYSYYYPDRLQGDLSFEYEGMVVSEQEEGRGIYQSDRRRLILRDQEFEQDAAAKMRAVGFRKQTSYYEQTPTYQLAPKSLPAAIRKLTAESWMIEADGKLYRQPGKINVEVTSGIDWFELHGSADFGGQSVKLPQLLAALRRGENMVRLDDGTFGVLPEQWLAKYGLLAEMGSEKDDHIRFRATQVGVLDALLASQPEARVDEVFEQARMRMRNFEGIRAADAPEGFVGTLRPYQREGLGWMQFLRDFNFGGCLADDMGLGKTVQVLALLESRRNGVLSTPSPLPPGEGANRPSLQHRASLVVAPRSLIFNWREEAAKFAPNLRVLDHTGVGRAKSADAFKPYDLILTTYGTLRNDAAFLKDVPFDYVVLDEAQAIKNASSESAKASRLLQGRHRLALSGTPVQNHLGELWSLFEFLNPGMLGTARAFQATTGGANVLEKETRELLSRALRPFLLRRTKQQVARELPERIEQTIHCELDTEQRKLYNELKEHYRRSLLSRVATEGIGKAKIQILEALLRLRQAACHPGLIDKSKTAMGSAKLDSLLAQISEVMEEDHKVLVFSQFTSFLAIVRDRLDRDNVRYEYLDGRTRDRAAPVEKFQTDPNCKLFLISLKAGGLGLNLTAAEYVFLLDPWWNPAVEAQAIDRAHRIGQSRQVFAYRLIATDTVEEKVIQLQQTKRDLADAIIGAENSLISKLGREDLELLLS